MNRDPDPSDDETDVNDPALEAVADAILEGGPINWTAAELGGSTDPDLASQLRVLAELAAAHRTMLTGEPSSAPAEASLTKGPTWGHLQLLEKVGQGAFGEVFRAWDPHLSREVALKLLGPSGPSRGADSPSWVLEEARFLAAIRHPNVVTVYGADRIDGRVGFWTEFIHGHTLAELVRDHGTFSVPDAAAIGIDACHAISAVHRAGLLHRDIKANNVMREEGGRIVLLDFGATKDFVQHVAADAVVGDPNGPTGTPLYVAPELWRDRAATPQSDIYSLGVLLYFLVTGSYPVRGSTVRDVGEAHRAGRRVSLRDERRDLPAAFVGVVDQAIDPDPSRRFENIDAFESALDRVRRTLSRPTSRGALIWKRPRVLVAASVIVALLGYVAVEWQQRRGVVSQPATLSPASALDNNRATPPAESKPTPVPHPPESVAPAVPTPTSPSPVTVATPRQVTIPNFTFGHPSRDGRFMPYVGADGNVQVFEIATTRSHPVTHDATADESGADWYIDPKGGRIPNIPQWPLAVLSPNGDRVAYTWALSNDIYELRVADADGKWQHTILGRRSAYQPVPVDWSRDGKTIVCWMLQKDGTTDLVLLGIDDRSEKVLYSKKAAGVPSTTLSPDGRFVVFERTTGPMQVELAEVGTNGGDARTFLAPTGNARTPRWIDDAHLFFLHRSTELQDSFDGWIAHVVDGVVKGEPERVLTNIGADLSAEVVDGGLVYSIMPLNWIEVYTVSIDLTGQAPPGPPVRISRSAINHHFAPSWSPDGRSIAYLTGRPSQVPGLKDSPALTIHDVRTASDRIVHAALLFIGGYPPLWLPDGESVLIWGSDTGREERLGYYRVNLQTNETRAVLVQATPLSRLMPDGKSLIYLNDARDIVSHTFATGEETMVVPSPPGTHLIGPFGPSRDGRQIAYVRTVTSGGPPTDVLTVQTEDGVIRELVRAERPGYLQFQGWTPDGQHVLFTRGLKEPLELWMASATGEGEPRDMQVALPLVKPNPLTVSPDGHHIAYPERIQAQEVRIRSLPLITPKKR